MTEDSLFLDKISQIERCLERGLDYPALALALTIPDVCAKAAYGETGGYHYTKWFQTYVRSDLSVIEKENKAFKALGVPSENRFRMYMRSWDYYNLRCAYLHGGKGEAANKEGDSKYVSFQLSTGNEDYSIMSPSTQSSKYGRSNTCMVANIGEICRLICKAARNFYSEFKNKNLLDECNIKTS